MDKSLEIMLKQLYDQFDLKSEFSVCSPEYSKEQIDMLVKSGYIKRIEASTLNGWEYIVRPTYAGKNYFVLKKQARKEKKKHNIIETLKYLVPVIIAIIEIIVAILK